MLKELVENSSAPYQEAVLTVELHEQIVVVLDRIELP